MPGTLTFVVSNVLLLALAWRWARAFVPASDRLTAALAIVAAVPVLLLPCLIVLGVAGWLTPTAAAGAVAGLLGVVSYLARRRRVSAAPAPTTPVTMPAPTAAVALLGLTVPCALALSLLVSLLRRQLLGRWVPHADDLSYHAPMVAHWLQAGQLVVAPYNYHAYYPGGAELFALWFMLPSRLDAPAFIAGAYWICLAALAAAVLCRRAGGDGASCALAAATVLSCRPFTEHAGTFAAVDPAMAAAVVAALALAAPATAEGDAARAPGRGHTWLVGGLLGAALGSKPTCAPLGLAVAAYFVLERFPAGTRRRASALLALSALSTGGFWYLRNFWLTAHPLFPAELLGMRGLLSAEVLRRTSLWFQLRLLEPAELWRVIPRLVDWPAGVAWGLIGACMLTLLSVARGAPSPPARRRLLGLLAGGAVLTVLLIAASPFSGTPNSPRAPLNIRLRFFASAALLAVPLVGHWTHRLGRGTPWVTLLATCALALVAGVSTSATQLALVCAVVAAVAWWQPWSRVPSRARALAPALVCVLVPCLLAAAMVRKQPATVRGLRAAMPAFSVLDRLPAGARVTWFSTKGHFMYYAAFGTGLARTPLATERKGEPYVHAHMRAGFAAPWRVGSLRKQRVPRGDLAARLRAQDIDYALLTRFSKRHPWASARRPLLDSRGIAVLVKTPTVILVRIDPQPSGRGSRGG